MILKEKQILESLENQGSPSAFQLFMEENDAENFSNTFHKKFRDLHAQIEFDYNEKKSNEEEHYKLKGE